MNHVFIVIIPGKSGIFVKLGLNIKGYHIRPTIYWTSQIKNRTGPYIQISKGPLQCLRLQCQPLVSVNANEAQSLNISPHLIFITFMITFNHF